MLSQYLVTCFIFAQYFVKDHDINWKISLFHRIQNIKKKCQDIINFIILAILLESIMNIHGIGFSIGETPPFHRNSDMAQMVREVGV